LASGVCGPEGTILAEQIPDHYRAQSSSSKKSAQFWRACQKHDDCYDSSAAKQFCDDRFLSDLRYECQRTYGRWREIVPLGECFGVAQTYYETMKVYTEKIARR
jgi:hypothetical protein